MGLDLRRFALQLLPFGWRPAPRPAPRGPPRGRRLPQIPVRCVVAPGAGCHFSCSWPRPQRCLRGVVRDRFAAAKYMHPQSSCNANSALLSCGTRGQSHCGPHPRGPLPSLPPHADSPAYGAWGIYAQRGSARGHGQGQGTEAQPPPPPGPYPIAARAL